MSEGPKVCVALFSHGEGCKGKCRPSTKTCLVETWGPYKEDDVQHDLCEVGAVLQDTYAPRALPSTYMLSFYVMLHDSTLDDIILHHNVLYHIVLCHTILYHIVSYHIILCNIIYHIILYYITIYYIICISDTHLYVHSYGIYLHKFPSSLLFWHLHTHTHTYVMLKLITVMC